MEQHIGNKFLMKYFIWIQISHVCLKFVLCYEMCLLGNDKAFGILIELLHYAKRRTRRLCLQRVCGRNRLNNEPAHDVKFLVLASPECPGQASVVVWAAPALSGSQAAQAKLGPSTLITTQLMLLLSFCIFTSFVFIQCTKNNGSCLNKETRVSTAHLSLEKSPASWSCWRALCTPDCLRLLSK